MMIAEEVAVNELLKQFISNHFSEGFESIEPMQGDAGLRNYFRVSSGGRTYVVMDSPPGCCSLQPFIDMSNYLQSKGFSAPEIIGQNLEQGFLLLEDFGSVSIKNYLLVDRSCDSFQRKEMYQLIIDLLVSLQAAARPDGLREYDTQMQCSEVELFTTWYIPYAYKRTLELDELEEFKLIWQNILANQAFMPSSIVLKDYHVENMMYLGERTGLQQLGLLDFQDAIWGSPIYDLVSVLEDARITVSRQDSLEYIEYFAKKKSLDLELVLADYHILGAQRNSKILGVFARKAAKDDDMSYLQYIPRVLEYLEYDLSHQILAPIKRWLEKLK